MELPKTLGDYAIGEQLGAGTVGTVYRAKHRSTGHEVALKVLIPTAAKNESVQKRFQREIGVVQRIEHPHVIRHFHNGAQDGVLYYTMELARHGSLDDLLRKRRTLSWRETAECGAQLASALNALHANGIIHRDLKPANIYLSADGKLKIGDFGLAKDAVASKVTLDGQTVGTIRYMAPEQIRGRDNIDGRLDLYALGCILFRCLAGRLPFEGATALETFEKHLREVPPRVETLVADCPASFGTVIAKLLEKEPENRPANGNVVARVLTEVLANPSRPVTDADFLPDESDAALDAAGESDLVERLHSGKTEDARHISWKKLVIALAVAAAAVMVLLLVRRA